MVWGGDDLGAWLVGLLADAGRKKLTALVLGDEVDRALGQAATAAIQDTAAGLCPADAERARQLAMVVGEVFAAAPAGQRLPGQGTVLEALADGIAEQLAVLDDRDLTGTGQSSAEALDIPAGVLSRELTRRLLDQVVARGARGGPLAGLAAQLNDDVTHLQGRRLEDMLTQLGDDLRQALAAAQQPGPAGGTVTSTISGGIQTGPVLQGRDIYAAIPAPAPVALHQLPAPVNDFTGRDDDLAVLAALLDPAGQDGAVVVSAVAGLAGVGKTALAVAA
ncbi:MAG TPA: hypothetical protein VIJ82_06695, partial [Streptosporangiaceae bacterium]